MADRLSIAALQCNPKVGEIDHNARRGRELIEQATEAGADVALFPELCLIGYPPEDLARKPAALRDGRRALERLAAETKTGCAALVTAALAGDDGLPRNAVVH